MFQSYHGNKAFVLNYRFDKAHDRRFRVRNTHVVRDYINNKNVKLLF